MSRFIENIEEVVLAVENQDEVVDLFEELFLHNYKIIPFPGCTTDYKEYIKWHKEKKTSHKTNTACEGFGIVLRLEQSKSLVIEKLNNFIHSRDFIHCIANKFGISPDDCNYDAGIQKYLDGYEISPHPDVRRKALTFLVNINPNPKSHTEEYHTSYLIFKSQWNYVGEFWKGNSRYERCWVPHEWCDTVKQQRENNSMILFAPDDYTMHSVKTKYNHLTYQRTQLYGNLWFKEYPEREMVRWEDLIIRHTPCRSATGMGEHFPGGIKGTIARIKERISKPSSDNANSIYGKRNY